LKESLNIAQKNCSELFLLEMNYTAAVSIILMEIQFGIYEKVPVESVIGILDVDLKEITYIISDFLEKRELFADLNVFTEDHNCNNVFKSEIDKIMAESLDYFL